MSKSVKFRSRQRWCRTKRGMDRNFPTPTVSGPVPLLSTRSSVGLFFDSEALLMTDLVSVNNWMTYIWAINNLGTKIPSYNIFIVSDYVKSMLWCRHRGAHNWIGGTIGEREREWEGKGEGGGQFTSNLGPEWTGITPHAKEGFQVSKRDSGTEEGSSRQKGIIKGIARGSQGNRKGFSKGLCMCLQHNINLVHIVLIV